MSKRKNDIDRLDIFELLDYIEREHRVWQLKKL